MKRIIFLLISLFFIHTLSAQNKKAGIYFFHIQAEDSLTRNTQIMSQEIIDSIKYLTERRLSDMLDAEVKCIYKINKNGKEITSVGVMGIVEGLPDNTYKNTRKNYDLDYYVHISCDIKANGGQAIALEKGGYSKIRPQVILNIMVYDRDKNVLWKRNNIKRGDFGVLHKVINTEREVKGFFWLRTVDDHRDYPDLLQPVDILFLYAQTLDLVPHP